MRINKFLANANVASRRKSEELILGKRVKVNGRVVTDLATNIDEKNDIVMVDNKPVMLQENKVYFMINKPKGFVSTSKDDKDRKCVVDLVPCEERIYSVGRLDYDSEGLLILTNDGELTYKLTHPKHNIEKTYIVKIEGDITLNELNMLRKGIMLDGEQLKKCSIKPLEKTEKFSKYEVRISEGRNRQIRRMFEHFKRTVVYLKRTKIGELKLGGLNRGEFRHLRKEEIEYLMSL